MSGGTGGTRPQVLTELAAAAPRRTTGRAPDAKETLEGVAMLGAAEPPAREDTGTSREEATEATETYTRRRPRGWQLQLLRRSRTGPRRHCRGAKRQVVPSLFGRLTMADNRAKLVSSNVAHARTSAREAAAAVVEAKQISSVRRLYVTTPLKDIYRISILPFFSSANQSEAAQELIRTTKSCLSVFSCCTTSATQKACAPPRGSPGGTTPSGDLPSVLSRLTSRRPPLLLP